ncbi:hypothetical protein [Leifsonia sp. 21MFCrub1.1]|uniref:hypothetical protein n=1 Tax=Leifsonia sp. 21MFCrub1.1 TaxID=1798223 RepID=UPI00089293FD|nr:hypothetical protein [Leifsonia sp. 21MFCrub1.1]SEB09702.1 hypothetical protein SAMN04515680_3240 [Leifsonia sp. 21MFCrub1.1]
MTSYLGARDVLSTGTDLQSVAAGGTIPSCVVEAFTVGKDPTRRSEDMLVLSSNHLAVIDGMSSPLSRTSAQASGRGFAAVAAETILRLPADASAVEAITAVAAAQRHLHPDHAGPAGAVAAIISLRRREVWRVGDVHLGIDSAQLPGEKDVDTALAWYRAAVNAAHLANGASLDHVQTEDPGLRAADELLRLQPALANRDVPFGYGVLNGTEVPERFIEVRPLADATHVVLATDGYLAASSTLHQAESELSEAIAADPAAITTLRGFGKAVGGTRVAPDDRTYLRINFHEGDRA